MHRLVHNMPVEERGKYGAKGGLAGLTAQGVWVLAHRLHHLLECGVLLHGYNVEEISSGVLEMRADWKHD